MPNLLLGAVMRRFSKVAAGAQLVPRLTEHESLAIAQVELAKAELTRAGRMFYGIHTAGVDPDVTIPTTTAKLCLANLEPDGGKCLILNQISVAVVAGTTVGTGIAIALAVSKGKLATLPAAAANTFVASSSRGTAGGSNAVLGVGVTLPTGTTWSIVGADNFATTAADVGKGIGPVELAGQIVVPPGHGLGIAALGATGTGSPKFAFSLSWAELQLDIE
jgi:hypothetical protein